MRYTLRKYTDASEVFNRVSQSLKSYFDSDLVLIDEYFKVIELCNANLGLRINPTHERLISLENYVAILPDDFLQLDIALITSSFVRKVENPFVTRIETLSGECPTVLDITRAESKCCDFKLECGLAPKLTCTVESTSYEFTETFVARLTEKKYCTTDCFNLYADTTYLMEINEGRILTDAIKEGKIYIQYTASMTGKGNIPICFDHPIIMEYYEAAIVYRVLKDLYRNKKLEIAQALPDAEKDYLKAMNSAISLATTPEFDEIISASNALKRRFRSKNYLL